MLDIAIVKGNLVIIKDLLSCKRIDVNMKSILNYLFKYNFKKNYYNIIPIWVYSIKFEFELINKVL